MLNYFLVIGWSIVPAPTYFYNLVKAYLRAAEKCRNFYVALEYLLPLNRNLLKSR
jgi:hypothetical protein